MNQSFVCQYQSCLNAEYFSIAELLCKKYKCETLTELFDAFVTYIDDLCKHRNSWSTLLEFALPRELIKNDLSIFDTARYFYPKSSGYYINAEEYNGERLNIIKLLTELGIKRELLETGDNEIECMGGSVTQSLSICKHQFNVDRNTDLIPIQICKPYVNGEEQRSVDRIIELLSIADIEQMLTNQVELDQVIDRHFSKNVLFYLDVDLKSNYGDIDDQEREAMSRDIHSVVIQVLELYSQQQEIETTVIGRNLLQSFHIYTKTVVRIDDCEELIETIRSKLIYMGYNKRIVEDNGRNEYLINSVIDMGVYPIAEGTKSEIRFPSSYKISNKTLLIDINSKVALQDGVNLTDFVLEPQYIRNLEIECSSIFNNNPMWEINIEEQSTSEEHDVELNEEEYDELLHKIEQEELNRIRVKGEIVEKYKLQKLSVGFKTSGDTCPICNNQTEGHIVYINSGETHFLVKCVVNQIEVEHTEEYEETKTELHTQNTSESITEEFELKHITSNKYTYDGDCCVCKKEHRSIGNRVVFLVEQSDRYVIICCRSRHSISIRKTLNNTQSENANIECSLEEMIATENCEHVHYDALNCHTSFVKSAVGTGKTYQVAETIHNFETEQNRTAEVLFLSTRVSFSHTITEEMQKKYNIKFDLYSDQTINICESDKMMIEVESLTRLEERTLAYDIVIIDEAVSILMELFNPISKQIQIINTLERFICKSRHMIVCDALLNDLVIDIYRKFAINQSEEIVINSYRPYSNVDCSFLKCESNKEMKETYLNELMIRKEEGKRTYSFFDKREDGLKSFYDAVIESGIYKPEDILELHGDNAETEIDDEDNITKHHIEKKTQVYKEGDSRIERYELIMTTSTITVGWDSEIDENFHGLHVLFKMENTNAIEIYENIHRLRNIKSETFLHTIHKENYSNEPMTVAEYFEKTFGNEYLCDSYLAEEQEQLSLELVATHEILMNTLNRHKLHILEAFMRDLGYTISFDVTRGAGCGQVWIDYKVANEDVFVPFECSEESLELFKDIYSNGINILEHSSECIDEELKQRLVVYRAVMKEVHLGKLKWDEESFISDEEQEKCFDIRNNRTINGLYYKLRHIESIFDVSNPITCDDMILNHEWLEEYAIRLLKKEKQEADILEHKELQHLYVRVLYLSFVTDAKHEKRLADFVEVHDSLKYLFDIQCPQKLGCECFKVLGLEYNVKMVSEMIKDCQFKFTSKQVRVGDKRIETYTVELIEN